jgi:3D (Asp-Asp-Asp) domain-containing protein
MTAILALLLALHSIGLHATVVPMSVSGYWNGSGAPPFEGLMRNGEYTRPGAAACEPKLYAQRAVLYVEGVGWVQCLDTGEEITEGKVDVWKATEDEAWAMERHQLAVIVLEER